MNELDKLKDEEILESKNLELIPAFKKTEFRKRYKQLWEAADSLVKEFGGTATSSRKYGGHELWFFSIEPICDEDQVND